MKKKRETTEFSIKGIAVSDGIVIGKAYLPEERNITVRAYRITPEEIPKELERFERAIQEVEYEIDKLIKMTDGRLEQKEADIFKTYKLIINDPDLKNMVKEELERELMSVEYAFSIASGRMMSRISSAQDEIIRARAQDVHQLSEKIMRKLMGDSAEKLKAEGENLIYVANDISPADLAHLDNKKFVGIALNKGSKTSHTAILARAFNFPAVLGLLRATEVVSNGDPVILDATAGVLIVNPTASTLRKYRLKAKKFREAQEHLKQEAKQASITKDGVYYRVSGNIEVPEEVEALIVYQAEGVGLYRTEFFYLDRKEFPSEQEQYESYKYVAERMFPMEVIIRTMDIGGDKFLEYLGEAADRNPDLGFRAIRFSLKNVEIFKTQLRAIIRANSSGNIKILLPLISSLEEFLKAKNIINETAEELIKEGHNIKEPEIGIMVEVPSAALIADVLADYVDFMSIGSNDLIQYVLAVERGNPNVAELYSPFHPAIIRLLKYVVSAAKQHGIWVGVCGAIAANPLYTMILIGLGVDELSMPAYDIPLIKLIIRSVEQKKCEQLVNELQTYKKQGDIKKRVVMELKKVLGAKAFSEFGLKDK